MSAGESLVSREEIEAVNWYHTIELPGGLVTRGYFDLRRVAGRALPDDLSGKRCLDACTASGFWAFEMERRGAAEVVAIDIRSFDEQDWQIESEAPAQDELQRHQFDMAHQALGSRVERRDLSIYDVSPALGGFDFVFVGAVLLHLRDPVQALRALRTVVQPGGQLRSLDPVLLVSSLLRRRTPMARLAVDPHARWWTPNTAAHRRWLQAAGFQIEPGSRLLFEPLGPWFTQREIQGASPVERARLFAYQRLGVPCQLLLAR